MVLHEHLVSHLISDGLVCYLRQFNEKFAIMHYIKHTSYSTKLSSSEDKKKISLRIRGGACYQLFSGTQRDPTCRTLLIGLEWKSLKNWPLGGARIYKREGASHLTATVKNSWFRSSLLQTGQLADQRTSYSNHLSLHTLSHKFLYGSHIYAMLCHEWAAVTARRRAASSTTAAAPRPLQCYSSLWYWSAAASSSSAAKLKVDHSTASANVTDHWS